MYMYVGHVQIHAAIYLFSEGVGTCMYIHVGHVHKQYMQLHVPVQRGPWCRCRCLGSP